MPAPLDADAHERAGCHSFVFSAATGVHYQARFGFIRASSVGPIWVNAAGSAALQFNNAEHIQSHVQKVLNPPPFSALLQLTCSHKQFWRSLLSWISVGYGVGRGSTFWSARPAGAKAGAFDLTNVTASGWGRPNATPVCGLLLRIPPGGGRYGVAALAVARGAWQAACRVERQVRSSDA
jgi:hypothetical protein